MANERLLITSGLDHAAAALSIAEASLPTLSLSLEDKSIAEDRGLSKDRGDRTQATLTRHTTNTSELTVTLSSTSAVRIPNTVTFTEGNTTASFTVSATNDTLVTGTQTATITAAANGFVSSTAQIDVLDDDVPTLSITLATDTIAENGRTTAGITRNTRISTPLTVLLSSSDRTEATVPDQITFNRGERLAVFSINGVADGTLDGTQTATISAAAPGFTEPNTAALSVTDTTAATDATIFVDATGTIRGSAFSAGEQYQGQLFSNTDGNTDSRAVSSDDLIVGTEGDDHIWAGERGSDRINSKGGHDKIGIGSGSTFVTAGEGDDFIYAVGSSAGTSTIALGEGNNSVWMPNGNSTITAGAGNDVIGLGTGTSVVRAGDGNNIIYQAATGNRDGSKDIITGAGEDYIALGSGDDLIDGGAGLNTLLGGAGADTFIVRAGAYNFLGDFELGTDKIRLVGLSADALTFFQGSGDKASSVFGFAHSEVLFEEALFEIVDATVADIDNHHIFN